MIGLYLVEQGNFLHCNQPLSQFLGAYCNDFKKSGWEFWKTKILPNESQYFRTKIKTFFHPPYTEEFITLKYHIADPQGNCLLIKHEIFLHKMNRNLLATNYFFDVTKKECIERHLALNSSTHNNRFTQKQYLTISPREKQVLRLIADGYSSKEIADKLFISNHTAVSHRKNLIEKFQVKNTAHLVNKASRLVLL